MEDSTLHQLLINLASATQDLPSGQATDPVCDCLLAMIRHLEFTGLLSPGQWTIGPRR
jgi:hypothetical protein